MARRFAPVWLMGLTNAVFGMYGGILAVSMPQLLSARHVPESTIASMTAVMLSPGFWAFIVSPILDVRFSRRWYSVVTAAATAALLVLAFLNLTNLALLEFFLAAGFLFANLYQAALGGWLASITAQDEKNTVSLWVNVANLGAGGGMALATGELVRSLPPLGAALLLGALMLLPIVIFPWMPAPGPDRRLARDSFRQFFAEVASLLKRREILIAIVLFVAPAATFSLTNFVGGLGADFHASSHLVGLVGGTGVLLGGLGGCCIFPLIDRLLPLRFLYLGIGITGALFTLALIPLTHSPVTFGLALIGENVFQALALTASTAIAFDTIGRDNPLAATIYCLMVSAFNVPVFYMLFVDGWGYARDGVAGAYAADAGASLLACLLMGALLIWYRRRQSESSAFDRLPATE